MTNSRPAARGATLEQLRADIDSGRTGDKVPGPDPAIAPLGTDDEAAGSPPSPETIDLARQLENRRVRHAAEPGVGSAWIMIVFTVFAGVVLVAFMALIW
jgi:hypothetical protein